MWHAGLAERGSNASETLQYVIDGHAMKLPGIQDGRKAKIEHGTYALDCFPGETCNDSHNSFYMPAGSG